MSEYHYKYNYDKDGGRGSGSSPSGGNKNNGDALSWGLIVVLFALGLWVVALPLLFIKLFLPDQKKRQDFVPSLYKNARSTYDSKVAEARAKREQSENPTAAKAKDVAKNVTRSPSVSKPSALILRVIGIAAMAMGAALLVGPVSSLVAYGYSATLLQELMQACSFVVAGGGMLAGGLSMASFMKRYAKYQTIIGDADAMSLAELAKKLGYSEKRVRRDMRKMIDKGFFGPTAYLNMELGYFFRSGEADAELAAQRSRAAEKTAEDKKAQSAQGYEAILRNIRKANDRIADPELTAKISRLEDITAKIFAAVEADPKKRDRIDTFMNYYLPTTQKLLDTYAQFEATGVEGENVGQAKERIEKTMDSIVAGFEYQLDQLYQTDAMDIDSDVSVMEAMLKRDTASAKRDFGLAAEQPHGKVTETPRESAPAPKPVDLGGSAAQEK